MKAEGPHGLFQRLRRRLAETLAPPGQALDVRREDVLGSPSRTIQISPAPKRREVYDRPLVLNWIITPPTAGSGGHTTILRMVALLESFGHECNLYLNDWHNSDSRQHRSTIRRYWPEVRADVNDLAAGMASGDALIATSWDTVYALQQHDDPGARCYFVQDFEPSFYPVGAQYVLAENTYRMGLHGITIGPWLAEKLRDEYGMHCDWFKFGSDVDRYVLTNEGSRDGIAFYARPSTPRRGYELGVLALELLHRMRPETPIHFFGARVRTAPFPFIDHGVVSPDDLAALYNSCAAGLVLSLTNISLTPWEMLASGCTPIINEASHNRRVLDLATVRYAEPTPDSLAQELCNALAQPQPETAVAARASVRGASWVAAARELERILARLVSGK